MFICDILPHDMSADFVVMAERRQVQAEMAKKLEVRYQRRPAHCCWLWGTGNCACCVLFYRVENKPRDINWQLYNIHPSDRQGALREGGPPASEAACRF